jgi:hypothetical protein
MLQPSLMAKGAGPASVKKPGQVELGFDYNWPAIKVVG